MREPITPADYGLIRPDILAWLAWRADNRRRHLDPRCHGISSDALADYAIGVRSEVELRDYPHDPSDLAACERTYRHAPADLQERMLPVLRAFRTAVLDAPPMDCPGVVVITKQKNPSGYRNRIKWDGAPDEAELREAWGIPA